MNNRRDKIVHKDYYVRENTGQTLRYNWYAEKFFKNISNKRILEIGCGDGGIVQFLKEKNKVFAVDLSKNGVRFLKKKGIEAYQVDVSNEALPFKNQSLDFVIILETLEHLKSPQAAIEEIQRVLKKDGIMLASIPNPRNMHKLMYPCLFNLRNFKKFLKNNKFRIEQITSYGICPPFYKQMKPYLDRKYIQQKSKLNKSKNASPLLAKISWLLSNDLLTSVKPKRYGFSFIFLCKNVNPRGARDLYEAIAQETKRSY